ncbi:tripartite tricarboxylate transporter permease [Azospirillum doebereinerae]|uniref:Tripartite tricarboxylate transporter permease n=2 Tax=Azospirillum doebereinerae TaxID=92933 RepID=A0A433J1H4_9PROT|nr:tripartite tricarboxylate transporter permease [Azospirillum doebereinerae]MCG5241633.1 tripartite tricarboxylate transporter permease [Azospirillum doebereinerae]RUQ64056.1 tripartite tricarboxylate transporter permease [Azospirillum doebereinerae]
MMLNDLILGFSVAATPINLFYCLMGSLFGTLVGVLPGVGPVVTIAVLLPATFALEPTSALIMLAGIYYGAQYGGSTTSILLNLPGETSSVVTCLDGHAMARQGRAGPALAVSALGSFFAGCAATLLIALFSPLLGAIAVRFGPADYFSLMVVGLVGAVVLAQGSLLKAVSMIVLGLLLGLVGTDVNSAVSRFDFGLPELADGINFVVLAMGLFGIGEIIVTLERRKDEEGTVIPHGRVWPSRDDVRQSWKPVLRGTALGSLLGLLPGGGTALASFAAYALEKKLSRSPERFGKGAIEGVAAPESANNAAAQTSFIPLLTLGLPSNAVMALMVGAMMIHGITPGPQIMTSRPDLFWGMIASMWIGNLMLVLLNMPMIGLWVRLLRIPYRLLYPAILLFACIGIYSVSNSAFDVGLAAAFGLLGYVLVKAAFEPAPLLLGFILGPLMEENLRRAMTMSRGDAGVFLREPVSLVLLLLAAALLALTLLPAVKRGRQEVFVE